MKILRAEAMGMCFGVRDALTLTESVEQPENVTIYGELVHNEQVLVQLETRGFHSIPETEREIPASDQILITAHGISDRERERLQAANKELIDTTCPLVKRVHQAASGLVANGYHVLVIGRHGHVEVRGIIDDLPAYDVIASVDEIQTFPHAKLGIVCQTTTPPRQVEALVVEIRKQNPDSEVKFVNTVCQPTRDRQEAADRLIRRVDTLVVVGGSNSNNTKQLVKLAEEQGITAYHVQSAEDLQPGWFLDSKIVGLTAGTSTLETTINSVYRSLCDIAETHAPKQVAQSAQQPV